MIYMDNVTNGTYVMRVTVHIYSISNTFIIICLEYFFFAFNVNFIYSNVLQTNK